MEEIKMKMVGPFNLVGEKNLFNTPKANSPGIYISTFRINDKYLIEYVGITTRSISKRFIEHIEKYSSGGYKLYDFQKMKDNKEFVVLKGRFGKNKYNITKFLNNYDYYSQRIKELIHELKVFLIPLDKEERILERIEGRLYQILREKKDEKVMAFIEGVRSRPKRENERSIIVIIEPNLLSSEIPSNLEI